MTHFLVDGRAKLWLEKLHLNPEEERKVEDCIARYTGCDSWFAMVESMIYRIINAMKSIFCVSDWQKARKIVQERVFQIAIQRGLAQSNPQNHTEISIRGLMHQVAWKIADKYMNGCLEAELESCVIIEQIRPTVVDLNRYLEERIQPELEDFRRRNAGQICIQIQSI